MEVPAKQVYIDSLSKDLQEAVDDGNIIRGDANGIGFSRKNYALEEEFPGNAITGSNGWVVQSGTGGTTTANTTQIDQDHWNLWNLNVTGTSGSNVLLYSGGVRYLLGGSTLYHETSLYIPTLSTAASNEYIIRIGFMDNFPGVPNNGVWIEYNSASTVNWRRCTANGGSRTQTDTGIAVTTGWHNIAYRGTGSSSVDFLIDDVSGGTNSSNFPTANLFLGFGLTKTANGATGASFVLDWTNVYSNWATSR